MAGMYKLDNFKIRNKRLPGSLWWGLVQMALFACFVCLGPAAPPLDGTIIYCQRNADLTTLWFGNLMGNSYTLVTTGWTARISLGRRHLVFLRNSSNSSAYGGLGDLWVRGLMTGAETNWYHDTDYIVAGDFSRDATQVFFDFECSDYTSTADGSTTGSATFLSEAIATTIAQR